ncbi:uncharacterized protein EHS24_007198 [Apiotrichum porosum]|uniref:Zinc knuckle-domain-containing protein n=1 Tax=Apiotrichum porosum TaxID=105984 RepID=A0A427XXH0_9TREE|nr:uncharacterized protein EHS24_007198 [Apiotrichum porosum]RSH83511.1 hypothetical protein EHS24_007198 [Apiotrichum porosum]
MFNRSNLPKQLQSNKASSSTRCQKCLKYGHHTYECSNARPYVPRPSRTKELSQGLGSSARDKPSVEVPEEFKSGVGLADKILRAKAAERESSRGSKKDRERSRSPQRKRRSSSSSSDSDSESDVETRRRRKRHYSTESDSDSESDRGRTDVKTGDDRRSPPASLSPDHPHSPVRQRLRRDSTGSASPGPRRSDSPNK